MRPPSVPCALQSAPHLTLVTLTPGQPPTRSPTKSRQLACHRTTDGRDERPCALVTAIEEGDFEDGLVCTCRCTQIWRLGHELVHVATRSVGMRSTVAWPRHVDTPGPGRQQARARERQTSTPLTLNHVNADENLRFHDGPRTAIEFRSNRT